MEEVYPRKDVTGGVVTGGVVTGGVVTGGVVTVFDTVVVDRVSCLDSDVVGGRLLIFVHYCSSFCFEPL